MAKKKKRGRPSLRKAIDEYKVFNKDRKKKDYRPGPDYPTVEEAKKMFVDIYTKRKFKVSKVQYTSSYFPDYIHMSH